MVVVDVWLCVYLVVVVLGECVECCDVGDY